MMSALVEMEHSHSYLYVHHNQSLLYNTTTDAAKKTIHASVIIQLFNNNLNNYGISALLMPMPPNTYIYIKKTKMWPMPNVMAALPNIGGALCSTLQSLADTHYSSAMQ